MAHSSITVADVIPSPPLTPTLSSPGRLLPYAPLSSPAPPSTLALRSPMTSPPRSVSDLGPPAAASRSSSDLGPPAAPGPKRSPRIPRHTRLPQQPQLPQPHWSFAASPRTGDATTRDKLDGQDSVEVFGSRHQNLLDGLHDLYGVLEAQIETLRADNSHLQKRCGLQSRQAGQQMQQAPQELPDQPDQPEPLKQPESGHQMQSSCSEHNRGSISSKGSEELEGSSCPENSRESLRSVRFEDFELEELTCDGPSRGITPDSYHMSQARVYKILDAYLPNERVSQLEHTHQGDLADVDVYMRQRRVLGRTVGGKRVSLFSTPSMQCATIHPMSTSRRMWDFLAMLIVLYDVVTVPIQISKLQDLDVLLPIEWASCIYWSLDILVSLNTSIYMGDSLETRRTIIAQHYFRTWMPVDAILVVRDWTGIVLGTSDSLSIVQAMRALKLLKFLRLMRFEQFIARTELGTNSNQFRLCFRIVKQVLALVFACHLISCAWYGLGRSNSGGWLEDQLQGGDNLYSYLTAAHWAVSNFIGSMDVHPTTSAERGFSVSTLLFALFITSGLVGSITQSMFDLQNLHKTRNIERKELCSFLRDRNISNGLAMRVKICLDEEWTSSIRPEADIMALGRLPDSLRCDISEESHAPFLCSHGMLCGMYLYFPRAIRDMCCNAMSEVVAKRSDRVFSSGLSCTRVLIITHGSASYVTGGASILHSQALGAPLSARMTTMVPRHRHTLESGQWLSEPALWTRWRHQGRLSASDPSIFLALEADHFTRIVTASPGTKNMARRHAVRFIDSMNSQEYLDDLLRLPSEQLPGLWSSLGGSMSSRLSHVMSQGMKAMWEEAEEDDEDDGARASESPIKRCLSNCLRRFTCHSLTKR